MIVAALAALVGFVLVAIYMSGGSRTNDPAAATQTQTTNQAPAQNPAQATTAADDDGAARTAATNTQNPANTSQGNGSNSVISMLFGGDDLHANNVPRQSWKIVVPRIIMRLALAALLVAALAFRPRRDRPSLPRNPYVAQTQILLAVVASALMMIVGDSAARAFGIFAAASLVRFRTNIRDPKETTVLLISLAIGLATGVGRWELALTLALFVLPLLWVLEHYELGQVVRPMQVTVKSRDTTRTQETLKRVFQRHRFNTELRQIEPSDEQEPVGCIVYFLNMNLSVSTDEMSEEIMSSDPENIEGIEWEQTKGAGSQIYQ